MKSKLLPFLAVAALSGSLSAACGVQGGSYAEVCGIESFADCGDAPLFIGVSFILVSLMIALAYMYGKFRQDAQAEVWAKDEAFNLLISVLLFAGLIAAFSASCSLSESLVGMDPFDSAGNYVDRLIQANGLNVLRILTYDSIGNQLDSTAFYFLSYAPFSGSGVAFNANLRSRAANKDFLIDFYLPILASLNAQKYLLQVLQWIGASILLPFAFVMRLIPFTREFGNVLLAVFFASYIVVPALYSLSGQAFEEIMQNPGCAYHDESGYCNVHNFYSLGIDGGEGSVGGANSGRTMRDSILYKIGITLPQAVFLPNLVIIVAVSCAMALSKALRAIAV